MYMRTYNSETPAQIQIIFVQWYPDFKAILLKVASSSRSPPCKGHFCSN